MWTHFQYFCCIFDLFYNTNFLFTFVFSYSNCFSYTKVSNRDFEGVEFVQALQPPPSGERWTLNATNQELYFVMYARSATLNVYYRIDKLGERCGAVGTCPPGAEDCACRSDGSCNRGLRCDADTLMCKACGVGTVGCDCTFAYSCNSQELRCRDWRYVCDSSFTLFLYLYLFILINFYSISTTKSI